MVANIEKKTVFLPAERSCFDFFRRRVGSRYLFKRIHLLVAVVKLLSYYCTGQ